MQFQCCISNCSIKTGARVRLYPLPNPVENKVLIEKWVQKLGGDSDDLKDVFARKNQLVCEQHYQDLYIDNSKTHDKQTLVMEPKEKLNKLNTIDDKKVPLVKVRKCAGDKPKVISPSAKPVYVLQKKKVHGKAKSSLLLLQPINRQRQNNEGHVQPITYIQVPNECSQVVQEVEVHTTETIDNNKNTAKKFEHKVVQKYSSHPVVETVDLTESKDINANEAKTKVFDKDLYKSLANTSEGIRESSGTRKSIIIKCKKEVVKTVGANTEIAKPTIFKIHKGLSTPIKLRKEIAVQPQTAKFMTLKNYSNRHDNMTTSPYEKNNVDTENIKPIILKKGKGLVINLMQCGSVGTVSELTQEPQRTLACHIASDAVTLGTVENTQVKENEKRSPVPNVMVGRNLSSGFVLLPQLETKANKKTIAAAKTQISPLLPEAEVVAKSAVDVTKIKDSNVNVINAEHSNIDVSEVSEVEVPEVTGPDVELPEFTVPEVESPEVEINEVQLHDVEAHANSKDKQGTGELKTLKTYLKKTPSIISPASVPRLSPSPVNTPKDVGTSGYGDRSKTAVPLIKGQIKRSVVAADEINNMIETIKDIGSVKKYVHIAINTAMFPKLSYEETEIINRLIRSFRQHNEKLIDEINTLKKQTIRHEKRIMALKKKLSDFRVNSKTKALERITKDMTEDAKTIIRMQVNHHKKKPGGRRFSLKEKLFSLALYKLSRQAYRYLGSILALPTKPTLDKFLKDLLTKLLVKDGTADVSSHNVKDGPIIDTILYEEKNETVTNDNSTKQNNDETLAAVATITDESARPDTQRCMENNKAKEQVECLANETIYPNFVAYTDDVYLQSDSLNCNNYINEIVFTEYVEQANDQTPKVIKIPSNCGTVSVGYSEYTQELNQYPFSENPSVTPLKKGNVLNHNKINGKSNQMLKKSYCYVSTTTEEKNQKIDFILSKMMTPDQLKKLFPKPRKKVSKKTGDAKKKIGKPRVQSGFKRSTNSNRQVQTVTGFKRRTKNDIHDKIMELKRNFIKVTPTLSHQTQTKPIFTMQPDTLESVSDFDRVMANRHNTEMYLLGPTSKHKSHIQQNIPHYIQHEQTNIDIMGHSTDIGSSDLQDTANEINSDLNAMDTVTKLRRNLQKYSPKTIESDTSFIGAMSQTTSMTEQILNNGGKRKAQSTVKGKNTYHYEREPIEGKRKKKQVIDESRLPQDSPRRCFSPEIIVRGTQDVNRSEYNNNPSHHTEGSVNGKGFDMPDLNKDFNSSYDCTNRKKFGFKHLPTNSYL